MSKETIAKAFKIGVATVYRILKKLESKSIIKRDGELISINSWKGKGNYFYIRHQLRQEIKEELKIELSLEEYAIVDITINQPGVKACEVQYRINCSKNSTNTYMKNISCQKGFRFKNGRIEITIKFENGNRLDIETIPKPMTAKVVNAQLKKMMAQKHEGITFKVIKWTANEIMFSRTKKGSTIFKSMFLVSSKGKEIMVSSNDVDDEKTCQELHAMAKTFKLN